MDLDDFVSETLRQIISGVAKAQTAEQGGINAAFAGVASGSLIDGGSYGLFSRIDFDVAVTAENCASTISGYRFSRSETLVWIGRL